MTNEYYSQSGGVKDEAGRQAGEVKDHAATEAADVKDHAATAAQDVAQTAGQEAKSVARDAKSEIRSLVDSSMNELNSQAGTGQNKLAEQLRGVVDELDGMAQGSERSGVATQVARELSDRGRGLAGWLESHEPRDAVDEVRRYAARNPWTFLAIAAGAGLIVGRFVRGVRDEGTDDQQAYGQQYYGQGQRSVGTSYAPPAGTYDNTFQSDPALRTGDPAYYATQPGTAGYGTQQDQYRNRGWEPQQGSDGEELVDPAQAYGQQPGYGQQTYGDPAQQQAYGDPALGQPQQTYGQTNQGEVYGDPATESGRRYTEDPFRGLGERE